MHIDELNHVAILLAALSQMIVGGFWYSPIVFANPWMRALGVTTNDISDANISMKTALAATALCSLVVAYAIALIITSLGVTTAIGGALVAVSLWLGLNLPSFIKLVYWEDRPWALISIDCGCEGVSFLIVGAIVGAT